MSSSSEKITFQSSRFGQIEVLRSAVIELPFGIIGFPECRNYVLLEYNPPFSWLHSIDSPELAFVVVSAAEFGDNYSFALPVGDKDIGLKQDDEVAILNLVTVRPDPTLTTVNLKAPVIVNMANRKGRQLILDSQSFSARHPLWGKGEE